ncbi:MAG TPA: hypothetical protein VNX86_02070 [Rhizomicrobium sp.]|jgi:hypothetical protein|nr:hypothetical protein [Rhizomicrobium sp.]
MNLQAAWHKCAIAGVLFTGVVCPASVDAQSASTPASAPVNKPATKPPPKPTSVRAIPFPSARGGPLQLPIEGLDDGISLVGVGRRVFGLCWAGGNPPYRVTLQDMNAQPVLQQDNLDQTDLTNTPQFTDLRTGSYGLTVSDGIGARANGRFTVVQPSSIPVAPASSSAEGDILAQSSALLAQGPAFDYEAYLRLLSVPTDNPEAQRMRNEICHRQFEATVAEAPAGGFPETEIILADASDLASGQFAGATFYYAYLTQKGALLSEAIYEYETSSANTSGGVNGPSNSQTTLQQATTLFEYGITNDLAVGAEISGIFETFKQEPESGPATSSHWSDPTFLGLYRVADQADAPLTAFLRASYSPAIVKNAQDVVDLGGTVIREQDIYAIAGVFDATYRGQSPSISLPGNEGTVKLGSDWRYNAALQSQAGLGDRWSAGLAAGYQFSYGRPEFLNSTTESLHVASIPYVSLSASYLVIPDQFRISLSYHHYFSTRDELTVPNTPTEFTRNAGTDAVSIILSSAASIDDFHVW